MTFSYNNYLKVEWRQKDLHAQGNICESVSDIASVK